MGLNPLVTIAAYLCLPKNFDARQKQQKILNVNYGKG
jgi:hypothetical protein